jgi:DNA ligase-associated metallophosphoesterase
LAEPVGEVEGKFGGNLKVLFHAEGAKVDLSGHKEASVIFAGSYIALRETTTSSFMDFYYKEELIQLLPEKVAFLPRHQILVVADIHLGKASHFRKEGIMIPLPSSCPDLKCLGELIDTLRPTTVVFLGDLFHSSLNHEWKDLQGFLCDYPNIRFVLTKGNHDILPSSVMEDTCIEVVPELEVGRHLVLTHAPMEEVQDEKLNIVGHIHPGVLIKTKSRQSFRLPCFFQEGQCLILPAFGQLTGLHILKKAANTRIFPVLSDEVIALP